MPSTPALGPATTSTGAVLPLIALPQTELLTVNEKDTPLVRDVLGPGEGVHVKPLRLDVEKNQWAVLATFEPGVRIPVHYHTGTVDAFTFSGCWYYGEYPDQKQTAGSYLYEPSSSVHTLICPESNTEDTVVLFIETGSNVNFSDDGQFHSILDAAMLTHLTETLAAEQNLGPLNYLVGGVTGLTAKDA